MRARMSKHPRRVGVAIDSLIAISFVVVFFLCSSAHQVLSNLSKNSASGTDYFKILVAVFVDVLAGSDQQHLKNFYAMYANTVVGAGDLTVHFRSSYFAIDLITCIFF